MEETMESKQVYLSLGFDREGKLVECRRNGELISVDECEVKGDQGQPAAGGPGSDPCIVRLPSGQLIRVC
jgi:hypothetical protein